MIDEVKELRRICVERRLSGLSFLDGLTDEQIDADYNGIGPEWFPAAARRAVDVLCDEFRPPAMIHDVEWSHSDGSREKFEASNERLYVNCCVMAKASCAWYNPRRYVLLRRARLFRDLCSRFGWSAYRTAYAKGMKK